MHPQKRKNSMREWPFFISRLDLDQNGTERWNGIHCIIVHTIITNILSNRVQALAGIQVRCVALSIRRVVRGVSAV